MNILTTSVQPDYAREYPLSRLAELAVLTCGSAYTRGAYERRIKQFLRRGLPLNREGVAQWIREQRDLGTTGTSIHQIMASLRKLAREALLRGLMSDTEYAAIYDFRPLSPGERANARTGQWLTLEGARKLWDLPDRSTAIGRRDAVLIGFLMGCGLRRSEAITVEWTSYQPREGRMCLVDVEGKGRKKRTVPIPAWLTPIIERWRLDRGGPSASGPIILAARWQNDPNRHKKRRHFGPFDGQEMTLAEPLGTAGCNFIMRGYSRQLGVYFSCHDLRRTFAKLIRNKGVTLEQIQLLMGHSSIQTTILYLGPELEMRPGLAGPDQIEL